MQVEFEIHMLILPLLNAKINALHAWLNAMLAHSVFVFIHDATTCGIVDAT